MVFVLKNLGSEIFILIPFSYELPKTNVKKLKLYEYYKKYSFFFIVFPKKGIPFLATPYLRIL